MTDDATCLFTFLWAVVWQLILNDKHRASSGLKMYLLYLNAKDNQRRWIRSIQKFVKLSLAQIRHQFCKLYNLIFGGFFYSSPTVGHEQEGTQLSGTASGAIFQCLCPKLHSWGVSPSLSLPSPLKKEFFSLLLLKQQLGSSAWGRVALQNCFASFLAGHLFFCSSRPLDRAVPQLLLLLTL